MSLPKYYVKANTYSNISPYPSWRRDFDYWQKDLTTNLYYLQGNVGIGYSVVHGGFVVSSNIGIGTNNPLGRLDVVGNVVVDSGSAFTPSFSFRDNNNTGIYQPTTNTLAFSTNGNQRMIVDASGNLILNNNLVVNGSTVSMNTDTVTINDPIITLGNNTSTDIYDRGVDFKWYNGAEVKNGFIGLKQSSGNFVLYNDASNINNVYSGTTGGLQIKSLVCDVSMGIAPLTITSSTLVTNLNADLLDGLTGSQFIRSDISTSCLGNIDVSGNISGANITASDTISGSKLISNIASGIPPLMVTSSTLVTNLNVDLLDGLNNTQFMRSDISTSCLGNISGANIIASDTISGSKLISNIASGTAPLIVTSSTLVTNLNVDLLDGLNNTQFMRSDINTSCLGNLGIGTSNPQAKLDVNGNVAISGSNIQLAGGGNILYRDVNATVLDSPSTTAYMALKVNTIDRITIKADGNVGIGTSNPQAKLHVIGSIKGIPAIYNTGNITGLTTDIPIDNNYGTSVIYWKLRSTNSTLIRFNMLLRFQINGTFQTSGYEKNVMATYNNNGSTINYINTGAGDGPIILYYADNFQDNAGEIKVFSPGLISRIQVQFDSSYTYGGIGAVRTYGSAHYTGSGTQITAIRLVLYQFDASNIPTGATGSYSVMGIPT